MRKSMLAAVVAAAVAFGGTEALAQAGNAENGEDVFKKCRACHDIGPGAKNKVGPVLNGIIGRKAGTIEGFNYSNANKAKGAEGLTWTEENLFQYLERPMQFIQGTTMAFVGIKDEQDRRDLIAYLKKFP